MFAERYQDFMYRFVESVLTEIGPRESCSENERRLGRRLAEMWGGLGLDVHTERFTCHPKAFLGFIPVATLLYLLATISYWLWPLACFVLAAAAAAMVVFELLRYREFIDVLFPTAEGENVIAIIRPRGEVTQRVIVSAHQDSAYEFNLWFFLKTAAIPLNVITFAAPLVPMLGGLAKGLAGAAGHSHVFDVIGYICMGLYPIVGLNFFFHTYTAVPGAMDDLAGVSVLAGVAQALADARAESVAGAPLLEHTEVRVFATSSEEAGLRGSKRYVAAHARELKEIPTYGLFIDGVYDEHHLTAVTRELFTGVRHDQRLVQMAKEVASTHGWPIREHVIPIGATDATPFSQAGIPSVCLLCQDTTRLVPNYHTRLDTIDRVRPTALTVMLQLVLDMMQRLESVSQNS
jgi:aminopeptidase YwaD